MDTVTSKSPTIASVVNPDLELARRLHRSLLPERMTNDQVDVSLMSREYQDLGGDYGTAYWQDDERLLLCVCDVTGHGIASALLAARINTFVRLEVEHRRHPCEIVTALNAFLTKHFTGTGIYATFFCVVMDWKQGCIQYAGAGHPPALLRKVDGTVKQLDSELPLLGVFAPFPSACQVSDEPLQSGDVLIMYTDGLIEAKNQQGDFYDIEGLESSLKNSPQSQDAEDIQSHLVNELESFVRDRQLDDDMLLLTTCIK